MKNKTVVDAVNYFEAEWPCTEYRSYMLGASFHNGAFSQTNGALSGHYIICTKEEFNQCVKEMSLNKYGQFEFDLYAIHEKQPLTKENSDYSPYESELVEWNNGDDVYSKETGKMIGKYIGWLPSCPMVTIELNDMSLGTIMIGDIIKKPKREKRWIAFNAITGELTQKSYKTEYSLLELAYKVKGNPDWQVIEIEADV